MNNVEKKQISVFFGIALIFMTALTVIYSINRNPDLLMYMIFSPALAALITRMICREGLRNMFLKINIKRNKSMYVRTMLFAPFIIYFGAVINYIIFHSGVKLLGMVTVYNLQYTSIFEYLKSVTYEVSNLAIIFPIYGIIQSFCEEFAWRGYLLPRMCKIMKPDKAAVLNGFLWGIWQLPIMMLLYINVAENPLNGAVMLLVMSTSVGVIQSYLLYKTESLWCPILFNLSLNIINIYNPASIFVNISTGNSISHVLPGVVGMAGLVIAGMFCYRESRKVYVD